METDREILIWFHQRLEHHYGESRLYDYMHRLRAIIRHIPGDAVHRDGDGCNSLEELNKEMVNEKKGDFLPPLA